MFLPKPTEDVGMFARPARDTREKENGRRANILILGQTAGHTYIWAYIWKSGPKKDPPCAHQEGMRLG